MAGMGAGYHSVMGNLLRDVYSQMNPDGRGGEDAPPAQTPPETPTGMGPGEAQNFNYGQQGTYNTLAQDMSRNVMGNYGFNNGMFNYSPFGNPYEQMMGGPASFMGGGLQRTRQLQNDMLRRHGFLQPPQARPRGRFPGQFYEPKPQPFGGMGSFPGYGYGGMTGRHNQPPDMGYGGSFGGSGYGSYGSPYARPMYGPQIQHIQQPKAYNFGQPTQMMTTTGM